LESGKIDPEIIRFAILGFSSIAALTDLLWGKIYNIFIAAMILSGMGVIYWLGGVPQVIQGFLGFGLALLLYGWMFAKDIMGGGDVKFLMALGIWGGPRYIFEVALLAVLIGGVFAVLMLLFKGRLRSFVQRIYYSAVTLVAKELKFEVPHLDRKMTLPFGVPLALAAVLTAFVSPLGGLFR